MQEPTTSRIDIVAVIKAVGLILGYLASLTALVVLALKDGDTTSRGQIVSAFVDIAIASASALGVLGIADRIVSAFSTRSQANVTQTAITTAGSEAATRVLDGSTLATLPKDQAGGIRSG